ncbi:hypothetical protein PR048_008088 [Dryococelus australis]|uniref:Uncharacterized protein n=1 Tax=Dryococelus australis TaxID=614101 RepID=A0ABQ9HW36_9NEOP|nr:hypothetical protein PR048_008088 [Dryococelus australis]
MTVKRSEYGAALECKGGWERDISEKTSDQNANRCARARSRIRNVLRCVTHHHCMLRSSSGESLDDVTVRYAARKLARSHFWVGCDVSAKWISEEWSRVVDPRCGLLDTVLPSDLPAPPWQLALSCRGRPPGIVFEGVTTRCFATCFHWIAPLLCCSGILSLALGSVYVLMARGVLIPLRKKSPDTLNVERRRNEGVEETVEHRENPPTNVIVRHDFHMRKSDDLTGD